MGYPPKKEETVFSVLTMLGRNPKLLLGPLHLRTSTPTGTKMCHGVRVLAGVIFLAVFPTLQGAQLQSTPSSPGCFNLVPWVGGEKWRFRG